MRIGMIGLGRMGANMVRRLRRRGVEVAGYNRSPGIVDELAREVGMIATHSLADLIARLQAPRVVWIMLPAGDPTEQHLRELANLLEHEDIVVDGGNANYHDSMRHAAELNQRGLRYIDAGVSGGVWGLENGYCLMVGGEADAIRILEPALKALAPDEVHGWAHVGPVGAGHFTKMIHNGIEYGMMQAMAEGFSLLENKKQFDLDLAQIAELWRYGSVVRSWLLDLTASALQTDQRLTEVAPFVADSGEGRWTVKEAVDQGVAAPVISLALQMRFVSQDERGYGYRLLSMMRNAFGGHAVKKATGEE